MIGDVPNEKGYEEIRVKKDNRVVMSIPPAVNIHMTIANIDMSIAGPAPLATFGSNDNAMATFRDQMCAIQDKLKSSKFAMLSDAQEIQRGLFFGKWIAMLVETDEEHMIGLQKDNILELGPNKAPHVSLSRFGNGNDMTTNDATALRNCAEEALTQMAKDRTGFESPMQFETVCIGGSRKILPDQSRAQLAKLINDQATPAEAIKMLSDHFDGKCTNGLTADECEIV